MHLSRPKTDRGGRRRNHHSQLKRTVKIHHLPVDHRRSNSMTDNGPNWIPTHRNLSTTKMNTWGNPRHDISTGHFHIHYIYTNRAHFYRTITLVTGANSHNMGTNIGNTTEDLRLFLKSKTTRDDPHFYPYQAVLVG
jgi:hypothetical protein